MDLVIKRLSSIEEASAGIIEAAENEKKALEQQMRERIQAFDEEAEKATQEKLDQIRSSLNEEMQKSLADLQKATEDSIQAIENDYNQNHEKLVFSQIPTKIPCTAERSRKCSQTQSTRISRVSTVSQPYISVKSWICTSADTRLDF